MYQLRTRSEIWKESVTGIKMLTTKDENAIFGITDIQEAVHGSTSSPRTALRQAQGERFRTYFRSKNLG